MASLGCLKYLDKLNNHTNLHLSNLFLKFLSLWVFKITPAEPRTRCEAMALFFLRPVVIGVGPCFRLPREKEVCALARCL